MQRRGANTGLHEDAVITKKSYTHCSIKTVFFFNFKILHLKTQYDRKHLYTTCSVFGMIQYSVHPLFSAKNFALSDRNKLP